MKARFWGFVFGVNDMQYILNGKIPIKASDSMQWARWYETADRRVNRTEVAKGIEVSTVFLSIAHDHDSGLPLHFETMVFGGELDGDIDRYHTWDEAERGHMAMVNRVRASLEVS